MKTPFLKSIALVFLVIVTFSCSKDEVSSSASLGSGSSTNTYVKLTAQTAIGTRRPNYIVMMFAQPVTNVNALPPIIKQVVTDATGLADFNLNDIVTNTSPTTYYFEAFTQSGGNYVLKSTSHPTYDLFKGSMVTSSIIVE